MIVHSEDRMIAVQVKGKEDFNVWFSHVESDDGRHLFVVATRPESHAELVAARSGLSANLKMDARIRSNAMLDYVECHPDGSMYQVNLDNLGPGPGKHGEPEHQKVVAHPVPRERIQERMGPVKMPMPVLAEIRVEVNTDLNQSGQFRLSEKERVQARQEAKQTRKPRL